MSEAAKQKNIDGEAELQTIANEENLTVELKDGTTVTVQKCKLRHAPATARLASTVLANLNITTLEGLDNFMELNNPMMIAAVIEYAYDDFITALSQMTNLTKDQLGDLEIDDALLVGAKVVEVNQTFFLNRVATVLRGLRKSDPEENQKSKESL